MPEVLSKLARACRRGLPGLGLCIMATTYAAAPTPYAQLTEQAPQAAPALAKRPGGSDLLGPPGRPVLVIFWASWCPHCREEMPGLEAFRKQHPEVDVFTVAVGDSPADTARFVSEFGLDLPVIEDPEQLQSRIWGVRLIPSTVLLDDQHRIRYRATGAVDWRDPAMATALAQLHRQ